MSFLSLLYFFTGLKDCQNLNGSAFKYTKVLLLCFLYFRAAPLFQTLKTQIASTSNTVECNTYFKWNMHFCEETPKHSDNKKRKEKLWGQQITS